MREGVKLYGQQLGLLRKKSLQFAFKSPGSDVQVVQGRQGECYRCAERCNLASHSTKVEQVTAASRPQLRPQSLPGGGVMSKYRKSPTVASTPIKILRKISRRFGGGARPINVFDALLSLQNIS